jgi:hypothetical protein
LWLRAGNFWWLVGTITIGTIVYSVIRVRGFVLYLTERIESMDPEAFQEMHSQVGTTTTTSSVIHKSSSAS